LTLEGNKALVRRAYRALNRKDWAAMRKLAAPGFVDHNPVQGQKPGVEGFMESRISLMKAFADFESTIEDMIAQGDKVVVRLTQNATHAGELWGLPPTNKRVTYTETTMWRVVRGKCVERWCNSDSLSLMMQLGGVTVKTVSK
jgi:predicted ester cyclase